MYYITHWVAVLQFARTCGRVVAADISADRLELAEINAGVYGVAHSIEFRCQDFWASLSPGLHGSEISDVHVGAHTKPYSSGAWRAHERRTEEACTMGHMCRLKGKLGDLTFRF